MNRAADGVVGSRRMKIASNGELSSSLGSASLPPSLSSPSIAANGVVGSRWRGGHTENKRWEKSPSWPPASLGHRLARPLPLHLPLSPPPFLETSSLNHQICAAQPPPPSAISPPQKPPPSAISASIAQSFNLLKNLKLVKDAFSQRLGVEALGRVKPKVDPLLCSCGAPAIRPSLRPRQNREDEFDLDLEDLMAMEAIWLSIQYKEAILAYAILLKIENDKNGLDTKVEKHDSSVQKQIKDN
nr:E3 ubiquitin-protein ligase DA2L-like isoform X2 [Ipomoea batatas]